MDHFRILRRAFEITRFYRALWIFGILLALTTAHPSGNGGGGGGGNRGTTPSPGSPFPPFNPPAIPQQTINTMIAVGIGLGCVLLLLIIGLIILRYLSQTALIRMVDGYESSSEKVSVGQGFRLGWSRGAFRIWLVDLFFFVIGFAGFVILLALAAAPLLLWLTRTTVFEVIGTVITIGLVFLLFLVLIIVAAAVSLWLQITRREIILRGRGVFDGIRDGWQMVRRHLGDVIIMGLIVFGIGLVATILTVPLFLLLGGAGFLVGGLPALLAGGITNIFAHGATPWIVAALVGVPILLAVVFVPLIFLGGLVETFFSTVWTLTYRELQAMEAVRPETPVEPGPDVVI